MIGAFAAFGMQVAAQDLRFAPVSPKALSIQEMAFDCWSPWVAGKKKHFALIIEPRERVYWLGIGDSPQRDLLDAPIRQAAMHRDAEGTVFRFSTSDAARHAHGTVLVTIGKQQSASFRLRTSKASYEATCHNVLPPKARDGQ
jgi:hypothetical protein